MTGLNDSLIDRTARTLGNHPKELHAILRFSDLLRNVDTIAEHQEICRDKGAVWWGKFGTGMSSRIAEKLEKQIAAGIPTFVFLASNRSIVCRARLEGIVGGGKGTRYKAPEPENVPSYYRAERCSVWFKLSRIRRATPNEKRSLWLYNASAFRPDLRSAKSLIYVTIRRGAS